MSGLAGFVSWVAGLWMVYLLFKKKGLLHGILGLIFIIYPFIWGIIHFKEQEIKTPMTVWIIAIVVGVVLAFVGGSGGMGTSYLFMFA